jgi:chromosome segregation ATPase
LFTAEFVRAIPVDVVAVLVCEEEFAGLDLMLPFLFSIVEQRCAENRGLRTEINALRQSSEEVGETIARLDAELATLETFAGTKESRLRAFEANFRRMQATLEQMQLDKFTAEFAEIRGRAMSSRTGAEFGAAFQELKASAQRLTELAQRMVVMLPKRRNAWLAHMEQWDATIKAAEPLAQQLKPTEELINLIDRQLLQLTTIWTEAKAYVAACRTTG